MKRLVHAILTASLLLSLAGCGGGGGGTESGASADTRTVTMATGRAYTLQEGDTIQKSAPGTVVQLGTDLTTGETTATLQSGAAVLVRR